MSQIDYSKMSDLEVKQYFLAHRDDTEAFQAYMERLNQKPRQVIIEAGEIDNLPIDEQIKIVGERLINKFNKKIAE